LNFLRPSGAQSSVKIEYRKLWSHAKCPFFRGSTSEKKAYDEYRSSVSSVNSAIHTAKINGFADGMEKGREEGMAAVFALIEQGVPLDEAKGRLGIS